MRVRVQTLATLYEVSGRFVHELELPEGARVIDAVRALVGRVPGLARLVLDGDRISSDIIVLVNGRPVHEGREGVVLRDGDTVTLIPPAGGG